MNVKTFELMFSKKKQLSYRARSVATIGSKAAVPESVLQEYMDFQILANDLSTVRIPDWFWKFVKGPMSEKFPKMASAIGGLFGGRPDNLVLAHVGDGLYVGMNIELKTEDKKGRPVGKLHGKQVKNSKDEKWVVLRNEKEISKTIARIKEIADELRKDGKTLIKA